MGAILKVQHNQTVLQVHVSMSGGSTVASISDSETIGLCQSLSSITTITTKVVSINTLVVYMVFCNTEPTKEIYVPLHHSIGTSIQINGPPINECSLLPLSTNVFVVLPIYSKILIITCLIILVDNVPSRRNYYGYKCRL